MRHDLFWFVISVLLLAASPAMAATPEANWPIQPTTAVRPLAVVIVNAETTPVEVNATVTATVDSPLAVYGTFTATTDTPVTLNGETVNIAASSALPVAVSSMPTARVTNDSDTSLATYSSTADTPDQAKLYGFDPNSGNWVPINVFSSAYGNMRMALYSGQNAVNISTAAFDTVGTAGVYGITTLTYNYGYNSTQAAWARLESIQGDSDGIESTKSGMLTSSRLYGYDSENGVWERIRSGGIPGDSCAPSTDGLIYSVSCGYGWNESENGYDKIRAVNSVCGFDSDTLDTTVEITLDLGANYTLIYVDCDTDCLVSTTPGAEFYGSTAHANTTFILPYQAQTIYAVVKSGIAAGATDRIRVRGMR
jgi:hypothetical protein